MNLTKNSIEEGLFNYCQFRKYSIQSFVWNECQGSLEDIQSFDEFPECSFYEYMEKVEVVKQFINVCYLKHVKIIERIFQTHKIIMKDLGLDETVHKSEFMIDQVKMFYCKIISSDVYYNKMEENGVGVHDIEQILEMLINIDGCYVEKFQNLLLNLN